MNLIKKNSIIVMSIILIFNCLASGEEQRKKLDLSKIIIPQNSFPKNWMLAHIPYGSKKLIQARNNISNKIINKEIETSWDWIQTVVNLENLNADRRKMKNDIYFISGLGEYKDDAAVLTWDDCEIIDSRFITFSVINTGDIDIEEAFKKYINLCGDTNIAKFTKQKINLGNEKGSYGKFFVDCDGIRGWFFNPIEWYQNNGLIIFVFDKILKPSFAKGADYPWFSTRYFGGTSLDDQRPFLRFEKSNREQLAREYYEKIKMKMQKEEPIEYRDPDATYSEPRVLYKHENTTSTKSEKVDTNIIIWIIIGFIIFILVSFVLVRKRLKKVG